MATIARGEVSGEIARYGVVVVRQYDLFCLRHSRPKPFGMMEIVPVPMKQVITEEADGTTILSKSCPKCFQIVEEGRYNDKELEKRNKEATKPLVEKKVYDLDE